MLLHLHVEYALLRELIRRRSSKTLWIMAAYGPGLLLSPKLIAALRLREGIRFDAPSQQLGVEFQVWLVLAICIASYWQWKVFQAGGAWGDRKVFRAGRGGLLQLSQPI